MSSRRAEPHRLLKIKPTVINCETWSTIASKDPYMLPTADISTAQLAGGSWQWYISRRIDL